MIVKPEILTKGDIIVHVENEPDECSPIAVVKNNDTKKQILTVDLYIRFGKYFCGTKEISYDIVKLVYSMPNEELINTVKRHIC